MLYLSQRNLVAILRPQIDGWKVCRLELNVNQEPRFGVHAQIHGHKQLVVYYDRLKLTTDGNEGDANTHILRRSGSNT